MPKIPTYSASLDYKPPRGDLDTAAMPGRMLAKFGEAVGEVGGKIARQVELADRMKQAAAEAARANGTAQAMAELRQTIADFDADTDPDSMMDRYLEKADGIRQGIADGIADPQVRAQVEEDTAPIVGVQSALIQGDRVRRLTAQGRQDLDNHLALYAGIATGARHPLEHDDAVDLAVGEIRRKAEAGFITDEDAAAIEQGFYADLAERQARRAIAADPESALASLEGGEDFATLPADRRARLIDEADRAVQAQAVARTTEAAAARRETLIRLPGFLDALRDGEAPDDGDHFSRDGLIATLGEEEGETRWGEIEDARAFGKQMKTIRWAMPDEITRMLEASSDSVVTDDSAPNRSLLLQAMDRRNEQLYDKPADYVSKNPRIAALLADLRQTTAQPKIPAALTSALQVSGAPAPAAAPSEDRRAATTAYANGTLAEQERLGLPADRRQVLPEAEAQELVARILDGDPKTTADILSDLAADWGDAWPTALADLSRHGLPGDYRLLAALNDPTARQTFAKVLNVQSADPGALRSRAGDDAEVIDEKLQDALNAVTDQRGGGSTILAMGPGTPSAPSSIKNRLPAVPDLSLSYRDDAGERRNKVLLTDNEGHAVIGVDAKGKPAPIYIPEGVDLRVFARSGEADREALKSAIASGDSDAIKEKLDNVVASIRSFVHGGDWDLQRPGLKLDASGAHHVVFDEFVDVATVAIGIYAAAAGIPKSLILEAERWYAIFNSDFGDAKRHLFYYPLPVRNVKNTELGYRLYDNNLVPERAE